MRTETAKCAASPAATPTPPAPPTAAPPQLRTVLAAHTGHLQLDAVRVMEQTVADGVGLVGLADDGVPAADGQLAGA